jgi:hypothetical protein
LQFPEGISPALVEEPRERFATLRLNQGILIQRPSPINVQGSRYNIVITSQHDRDISSYQLGRVVDQPIKPGLRHRDPTLDLLDQEIKRLGLRVQQMQLRLRVHLRVHGCL